MSTPPVQRKLAAILAADVAGYSRLMGADEAGTARALREHREAVRPIVVGHGGRIVKTTGDGVLLEFPSVVAAVECAVAVQKLMAERNSGIADSKRMLFRIGINVGDVIIDGEDILGDGVNIAARLEGIAEPGGILLSDDAYRQVRDRLKEAFVDLGEQTLKNIAHPVRVYSLAAQVVASLPEEPASPEKPLSSRRLSARERRIAQGLAAAVAVILVSGGLWFALKPTSVPHPATPPNLSIVVLPFGNLSGDPAQDYLADVLTEELTTYLSRIPGTFVIARSTAFVYSGKPVDVKQLGKELGVRYVLEGSVQPTGSRLRVNTQLIDSDRGAHVWAEGFDADRTELLEMENEIVTRLARSLEIQLTSAEAARIQRAHPTNPDAEDLAMRCEAVLVRQGTNGAGAEAGYSLCEQAIQRDDHNVRALLYVALKYGLRALYLRSSDREADIRHSEELLSRALAYEPDHYVAYLVKSHLLSARGRPEEALVEAERALALYPSFIGSYLDLCWLNLELGRPAKCIAIADNAARLSPRDPYLPTLYWFKGIAYNMQGEYDRAIEWDRRSMAADPDLVYPLLDLAVALALEGHDAEARDVFASYHARGGPIKTVAQARSWAQSSTSNNSSWLAWVDKWIEGLRKAGVPEE
jgi:TolB-like protein/class 3 adenylate cyclase/Tfp pilus assembly protein PilF